MQIGDIAFEVHTHIVNKAPFQLLLGRPFHHLLLCQLEDQSNDALTFLFKILLTLPIPSQSLPALARLKSVSFEPFPVLLTLPLLSSKAFDLITHSSTSSWTHQHWTMSWLTRRLLERYNLYQPHSPKITASYTASLLSFSFCSLPCHSTPLISHLVLDLLKNA